MVEKKRSELITTALIWFISANNNLLQSLIWSFETMNTYGYWNPDNFELSCDWSCTKTNIKLGAFPYGRLYTSPRGIRTKWASLTPMCELWTKNPEIHYNSYLNFWMSQIGVKENVPVLIILSFTQTWLIFARFSIRSLSPSDCAESDLAYSSESNARYINVFANAAVDFENPSFWFI